MLNLLALALLSTAPPATAPDWLVGDWEPYSNAFTGLRLLSVGKEALSWHGCADARFEVVDSKDDRLTLRLARGSTCRLDDEPPSRMDTVRFTLRENRCDLAVSIYPSPEAAANDEPSAEGLYGRLKCPSGPAPHAAASLSTTPR